LGRSLLVVVPELTLKQPVGTLDLLLFAELICVIGHRAAPARRAMLTGFLLELALRGEGARRGLQSEVDAFAAGKFAGGTNITSHSSSAPQTRRFFGGRQPLCGIGVTSMMLMI